MQSLESELVRACVLKVVSLPLWHALSEGRREIELLRQPQLAKRWAKLLKKDAKVLGDSVDWQFGCMDVCLCVP